MSNKYISLLNMENELNISRDVILKIIYNNSLDRYIHTYENEIYIDETFKGIYKDYIKNEYVKSEKENDIIKELRNQIQEKDEIIKQLQSQIIEFADKAQKLAEMTLQSQMQQNYIKTLEAPKPQGIFKRLFSRKEKKIDDI